MELRHLRYFVAVAEALHFGQAAARLRIAQPSLSHQIRQLEAEVQTTLLNRTKRHVELTEAGRLFLQESREILARADRAALIARRAARGEAGRLRVGVGFCMDQAAITAAVTAFHLRHGSIRVDVQTVAVPLQIAALRDDRLDVGFVRAPMSDPALETQIVASEPLVAALPARHRLLRKKKIALAGLANDAFLIVPRDAVPVFHDAVLRACREAGFVPHVLHEADQLPMLLGMVAAGHGVALVPAAARKTKARGVVFRALHPSAAVLQTAVAWRRDNLSPAVLDFLDIAREAFARS